MCRKNRALGWCLTAAGVGALLTILLGSNVLASILALVLIAAGLCIAGRK